MTTTERLTRCAAVFGVRAYPSPCGKGVFLPLAPSREGATVGETIFVDSPVKLFKYAAKAFRTPGNELERSPIESLYL